MDISKLKLLIKEELYLLTETYESHKEIVSLSKEILHIILSDTIHNNKHITEFDVLQLSDVDINNYDVLRSFITDCGELSILIQNSSDTFINKTSKGSYITNNKDDYEISKFIVLNYDPDIINYINNDISTKKQFRYTLQSFLKKYEQTLIHELTHAFDDYRSVGLALNQQISNEQDPYMFKRYLNQKHEVDARFAQAIEKTQFSKPIFLDNDIIYKIQPIQLAYNNFKYNYEAYNLLPKKEKDRLKYLFGKFYVKKKEEMDNALTEEVVQTNNISIKKIDASYTDDLLKMINNDFLTNGIPTIGLFIGNKIIGGILMDKDYLPYDYRIDIVIKRHYRKHGYLKLLLNRLLYDFKNDNEAEQISAVVVNKKLLSILKNYGFEHSIVDGEDRMYYSK